MIAITRCDETLISVEILAEIEGNPVTSIEMYAFYDCTGLTDITIPNRVTSIGLHALEGDSSNIL